MNHIRKCADCSEVPPDFIAVLFREGGREHGKLVCEDCAKKYTQYSTKTVEQIIALKGKDLDNIFTWTPKEEL